MKSFIAILLLGVYLHTSNASLSHVGCAGNDDSFTSHLLAKIPVIGRKLLQNWKPCEEEKNTRMKGKTLAKFNNYTRWRSCCVKCKEVKECIAWSHNPRKRNCKIFANSEKLEKVAGNRHTAGILQWRVNLSTNGNVNDGSQDTADNSKPRIPSPPAAPFIPNTADDSDNHYDGGEGDNSGYDAGKAPPPPSPPPTPSNVPNNNGGDSTGNNPPFNPLPPSGDMLRNKVVYGRRLNSYMPCRGNVASNAKDCQSQCTENMECKAWTFAPDFNCGWVGESMPMGLCYLMADVTGGNIYDAPAGDAFISGFN
ncbi:hypothetical protein Ndes2526B_g05824 [Nannochloris sp. 'desiccata']